MKSDNIISVIFGFAPFFWAPSAQLRKLCLMIRQGFFPEGAGLIASLEKSHLLQPYRQP